MLTIDRAGLEAMAEHGQEGYPHEICGVLLGTFEDGMARRHVREVHRARNVNEERAQDRYELDPKDYNQIERRAREQKLDVMGIYHSHPDHPSRPSETDRQRAADLWDDAESWSYVILEVAQGSVASQTSWVLRGKQFDEEPIEIADGVD
jgi:proteasome lid subunit RPN8/RPN11